MSDYDTKPAFTPGPWGVEWTQWDFWIGPQRAGRMKVEDVVVHIEHRGLKPDAYDRCVANANLIAAAPLLYEALLLLLEEVDASGNLQATDFGWPKAVSASFAALAAARGDE